MSYQPPHGPNGPWSSPPPPPYNAPTAPYGYPPPRRPGRIRRFTTWYRIQPRLIQVIVAIGLIAATLFVGSAACVGTVQGIAESFAPTPTVQSSVAQNDPSISTPTVDAAPTDTPTDVPTPTPKPTPKPTPTAAAPTPTPAHTGVNGNPWGYDFTPGNLIYDPPADFCSYFACISSFWNGRGFVNECNDETYSKSGGISGDCSRHGGEMRPLYSH